MALTDVSSEPAIGEGLEDTRGPLDNALHLPGHIYTSPEIFRLEKEKIFMKDWLCLARVEEVAKPGDYMTFRIMGEPVVVARDEAGHINAFSNICRHRGVEVAQGEGNANSFKCPYHAWTYDLTGRLIRAPYMEGAGRFDLANCRLRPLRSGVWAGFIFVTFDDEAEPLEDFVAVFEQEFGFLRHEDCRVADKFVIELDCNWKLLVENFLDMYHISATHTDTLGREFPEAEDFPYQLQERGGYSSFFEGALRTEDGRTLFEATGMGKIPWLADRSDSFAAIGYLAPNFHIFPFVDSMNPLTVWPLSPTKTRAVQYLLVPEEKFELPNFKKMVGAYHDLGVAILEDDRAMVVSLQNSLGTKEFRPGPMSLYETAVHNGINYYLDRMFGSN